MTSASAQWIDDALAELEGLEAERSQHEMVLESSTDEGELRARAAEMERLEREIRGLYSALEAVADEGEEEDTAESANTTSGYAVLDGEYDPFDPLLTPQDAEVDERAVTIERLPLVEPRDTAPGACRAKEDEQGTSLASGRSRAIMWIALGVGVLGLFTIGVIAMLGGGTDEDSSQPSGPATVIRARAFPEGAQESDEAGAAGEARVFRRAPRKKGRRSTARGQHAPSPPPSSPQRSDPAGVGKDGKIRVQQTEDPLGGI